MKAFSTEIIPNLETKELIVKSQAGCMDSRNRMVECNLRLVMSVVQRYKNKIHQHEDLFQIGTIGLLKAIDKFDLSFDVKFSTYAVPMIIGEIQRFLRDDGVIKVSRSLKETHNRYRKFKGSFEVQNGRKPTIEEICIELEVDEQHLIESIGGCTNLNNMKSIHETVFENDGDPLTLIDQMPYEEKGFDYFHLNEAIKVLDDRLRYIVLSRFFEDKTQTEIAEELGISQVQVSRLEIKAITLVRNELEGILMPKKFVS